MGVQKERRKFAIKGSVIFGAGDVGLRRSAPATLTIQQGGTSSYGTLDLASAGLRVPYGTAAASQVNVGTVNGSMRVSRNASVVQLAFSVNGTAFVMSGTVGGAVTLGTAP